MQRKHEYRATLVGRGASIGANATLLPGVQIGSCAFIGAGSVVTRSVAPYALAVGTPAQQIGWISRSGERLHFVDDQARCAASGELYRLHEGRVELML
ncbi:MAG: hypothetical protein QM756_43975 [Polyangiaceae bacterium]